MGIQIISISHKIAPLHVREMFAFTGEQQKHMMQEITEHLEVSECIVLSTCNRTEMYVYSDSESKGCVFNLMEDVLLGEAGAQDEEDIGNYLLFYHGKKVSKTSDISKTEANEKNTSPTTNDGKSDIKSKNSQTVDKTTYGGTVSTT